MVKKVCSSEKAAALLKDSAVVACSGHINMCLPEEICIAVEKRWIKEKHPQNLTLISGSGVGDLGTPDIAYRGFEHFAHEGLVKRMIVGHNGSNHKIMRMQQEEKMESYNLPYGVIEHMLRARAQGSDIYLSKVGLGTFVDPRLEGGKTNVITTEDLVSIAVVKGEEYLVYDTPKIDVAMIRGTYADEEGNISCEDEAAVTDILVIAMAARASGGIVICQVKNIVKKETLPANKVVVPGIFTDYLVVCQNPVENHRMTQKEYFSPAFLGQGVLQPELIGTGILLTPRKVIARRAAMELKRGCVINLGLGIPECISDVAKEEGIINDLILTVDPGVIGGIPAVRTSFGASVNPSAILDAPTMFDMYDSGFFATFVGFAECDAHGSVNASLFVDHGGKEYRPGTGGFINLTQGAERIIFCGTMTAGGFEADIRAGKMKIKKEGREKKFVSKLKQITFSGPWAVKAGKQVLYVTERCVFRLTEDGLVLAEIAPGISIEHDILPYMEFVPKIDEEIKIMEPSIFAEGSMKLEQII